MYKKKLSRVEEELKVVEKERRELKGDNEQRRADSTRYLLLYEEAMGKLKDHIFEMNDLAVGSYAM